MSTNNSNRPGDSEKNELDDDLALSSLYASSKTLLKAPDHLKVNIDNALPNKTNKNNYWVVSLSLAASVILSVIVFVFMEKNQEDNSSLLPAGPGLIASKQGVEAISESVSPEIVSHPVDDMSKPKIEKGHLQKEFSDDTTESLISKNQTDLVREAPHETIKTIAEKQDNIEQQDTMLADVSQNPDLKKKLDAERVKEANSVTDEATIATLDISSEFGQQFVDKTSATITVDDSLSNTFKRFKNSKDWHQDILRLLDEKKVKKAELSVVAFREEFPDYSVDQRLTKLLTNIRKREKK